MRCHRAFVLAFFSLWACDPDPEEEGLAPPLGPPAEDAAKAAAAAAAAEDAAAKDAAADFTVCMAGCSEGKALSPTDRHTCRLTCGADQLSADGPGPTPATKAALARFEHCLDQGCTGPKTDAATCRLTCAQQALTGAGPDRLSGQARGCSVSCLEEVGECEGACSGGTDDSATCRLHCQDTGQRCLGRCEQDPSAPAPAPTAAAPFTGKPETTVSVPEATRAALPPPEPAPEGKTERVVPGSTRKSLPTPP